MGKNYWKFIGAFKCLDHVYMEDYSHLINIFSHKNPSSKMTRIRHELSNYDFDRRGANNTNADALSRLERNSKI